MSVENVLDEVESFIQKLSSLPDDVRFAAINKIQERLSSNGSEATDITVPTVKVTKGPSQVVSKPKNRGGRKQSTIRSPRKTPSSGPSKVKRKIENFSSATQAELKPKAKKQNAKSSTRGKCQRFSKVVHVNVQLANKDNSEERQAEMQAKVKNKTTEIENAPVINCDDPKLLIDEEKKPGSAAKIVNNFQELDQDVLSYVVVEALENAPQPSVEPPVAKTPKPRRIYACHLCERTFRASSNLKVHMKRHLDQRDFACEHCSYRSVTKMDLERHFVSTHSNAKDFICEYCAKEFSIRRSLILHIRNKHSKNVKEFSCSKCPFTTHCKTYLKVHLRLRHLGDYYTHVCPVCDARVKLKSAFIEHMRAHTGERPFVCTVPNCNASFACVGRLNTHLRTIHGPRQFTCPTCDKKFPTKYGMQRHETTHTKAKPHACPFCSFACNMQGNLTKHIRTMHARPDFSLRKYKNNQQRAMEDKVPKSRRSWKAKGQEAVKQYLSVLSQKLGRKVTVEELRVQEEHRKKQLNMIKEKAMRERINKITLKEHSYVQQPPKSPSPVPSTLEPISSNIYMEAMIAANLDFSSTALAELPDLSDPISRPLLVTCNLEAAADYANAGFIMPDATEDKMDPLLSNYSDILHVPASLGLEPYSVGPTLVEVPGLFVQFPSGEKLQLNLNMLRDSQLLDMTPGMVGEPLPAPSMPLAQIEGLLPSTSTEFLPSVMIVVSDPADTLASS